MRPSPHSPATAAKRLALRLRLRRPAARGRGRHCKLTRWHSGPYRWRMPAVLATAPVQPLHRRPTPLVLRLRLRRRAARKRAARFCPGCSSRADCAALRPSRAVPPHAPNAPGAPPSPPPPEARGRRYSTCCSQELGKRVRPRAALLSRISAKLKVSDLAGPTRSEKCKVSVRVQFTVVFFAMALLSCKHQMTSERVHGRVGDLAFRLDYAEGGNSR
jgi:hypothetical protein